jgi:hypothetical protein
MLEAEEEKERKQREEAERVSEQKTENKPDSEELV